MSDDCDTTTLRAELEQAMTAAGDSWDGIEGSTATLGQLSAQRERVYLDREPITVWTRARVYFLVRECASVTVCSVPRNPSGEPAVNFGGYG